MLEVSLKQEQLHDQEKKIKNLVGEREYEKKSYLHIPGNNQQDVNIKFFLLINLFCLGRELLTNVETKDM